MAIERNRKPLLRIVATLFVAIGLAEGGSIERLPGTLYRMVLSILTPAEAAVRRLIVVAARNLVVKPPKARAAPKGRKRSSKGKGQGQGRVVFWLFDPRKRLDWVYDPRTKDEDEHEPAPSQDDSTSGRPYFLKPPAPAPDGTVNAQSLCRRLTAIKQALEDLTSQARRYARWRAKPYEQRRPKLISPLRLGPPPGQRKKATHEVDNILTECHFLAWSLPKPDTS